MPETTSPLSIAVEPLDERRCKFVVNRVLGDRGAVHKYTSLDEARGSPIGEALLSIPGIHEVVVAHNVITATKSGVEPWDTFAPRVRYAVDAALSASAPVASPRAAPVSEDQMYDLVDRLFREQINPAVAQHGGRVELVDVQDGIIVLRMMGGCHGCGMASVTLRQGIEASLRRHVPGFVAIRDITDHTSGKNPYFAAPSAGQ
jgi:Fe-S cluster biogenesis protein NfuA